MMRTWANINGKLEFIGFCSARGEEWVDGGDGYTNDSSAFGNPVLTNPEADAT